jgi:4-oxalmesaconate hydratase
MNKWTPFEEFVRKLYFDTTVYNDQAMNLLVSVVGVDNVMFASEMLGGVTTRDPLTGRMFDDNKPCLDALGWLTEEDRRKIFEGNVRRAYPRLNAALDARAAAAAR